MEQASSIQYNSSPIVQKSTGITIDNIASE